MEVLRWPKQLAWDAADRRRSQIAGARNAGLMQPQLDWLAVDEQHYGGSHNLLASHFDHAFGQSHIDSLANPDGVVLTTATNHGQ
jgi:hypothetical protein